MTTPTPTTDDEGARQPVHTVYGGAHLFKRTVARRAGEIALAALDEYAPTPADLADALGIAGDDAFAERVHSRVRARLEREPVQDYRVDFEDGYGHRGDDEEDAHCDAVATELAAGLAEGTLPAFTGVRIKSLAGDTRRRAVRTLERVVEGLLVRTRGALPPGFVVTLPKVTLKGEVALLAEHLASLEAAHGLPRGAVRVELMVETPGALFDPEGRAALPSLVAAAEGRCRGAHFGAYDYTASVDVSAAYQSLAHPACVFARQLMKATLAGTGVWVSDGATTLMPVGPHRARDGVALTDDQRLENARVVRRAWRAAYDDARRSLAEGIYQGWDLHPAQLVARYAALAAFFLEGEDAAAQRLRAFVARAAQATRVGDVFDDAATGQGLLNYFIRAVACGALTPDEVLARTGVTHEALRARSFRALVAP